MMNVTPADCLPRWHSLANTRGALLTPVTSVGLQWIKGPDKETVRDEEKRESGRGQRARKASRKQSSEAKIMQSLFGSLSSSGRHCSCSLDHNTMRTWQLQRRMTTEWHTHSYHANINNYFPVTEDLTNSRLWCYKSRLECIKHA